MVAGVSMTAGCAAATVRGPRFGAVFGSAAVIDFAAGFSFAAVSGSAAGFSFSAARASVRLPDSADVVDIADTPDTADQSTAAPPCPRRVTGSACVL
jgi:hypothetical protein